MSLHSFTFKIVNGQWNHCEDRLYEGGFDDGLIHGNDDAIYISFDRDGTTRDEVRDAALKQFADLGFKVEEVHSFT